ncbi:MAG TPA: menaquinone biosynthesis protein, partial [Gemmatimonadales bacterium]|nr:menaquinone biosynthesis protein [Gemmatimonadales bacterium]
KGQCLTGPTLQRVDSMRVGRIGYINCAPVYGAIDRGVVHLPPGGELVTGTPAELNDLLVAGELDVSVISAIEYARHAKALVLLPDLAISCDGPVRSVALFSRRPVRQLGDHTILISASSRTSVALLELLCREVWHIRPRCAEARAEAQDLGALAALPHEAVLVIGDAALTLAARGAYPHRYDLGEAWKRWTGLPFVFAVWAARRSADQGSASRAHTSLLASRAWGLAHLDALAQDAARATGVAVAACREYLGGLDYALTYKHLAGLTDFFRRLAALGMVPDGALQFMQVA